MGMYLVLRCMIGDVYERKRKGFVVTKVAIASLMIPLSPRAQEWCGYLRVFVKAQELGRRPVPVVRLGWRMISVR